MSPFANAPRMADYIAYQRYADEVLAPQMERAIPKRIKELEAEGKYDTEEYDSLLVSYYERHVFRQPMESWPEWVVSSLEHANKDLYVYMRVPANLVSPGCWQPGTGRRSSPQLRFQHSLLVQSITLWILHIWSGWRHSSPMAPISTVPMPGIWLCGMTLKGITRDWLIS